MVRDCKTLSFFSVGCPHRTRFVRFLELQSKLFGVSLPVPTLTGVDDEARLSSFKKFCGGLIEGCDAHEWHEPTSRLDRTSRMSISMSLFLYRKVLPSREPDVRAYLKKMSSPGPPPDPRFLEYVRVEVDRMFPPGWDSGLYERSTLSATVPMSACKQLDRASGGARMHVLNRSTGWNTQYDFVMDALVREHPIELCPSRLAAVETGGKYRIVSVGDADANLFRPLHASIYNHISKKKWLLRGDAKASRFNEEFKKVEGEVFCSGDYESATDNLSREVSQEILEAILKNTTSVPAGIRSSAGLMLATALTYKGSTPVVQERGQLMGNLLSFPILCIVNYLAFRYFSGTSAPGSPGTLPKSPVRINGDDIVFRATPEVVSRWMEGVKGSGLVLSRGKTMVDGKYFSLNSSLFLARPSRVSAVPMIRSTALGYRKDCGGVETLQGRFNSFAPGFFGRRKHLARVEFLRWNARYVYASRRSCVRGLGLNPTRAQLVDSGLWARECYYLSFEEGIEKPIPLKPTFLEQERKPAGWELRRVERITKEMRKLQKEIGPAFVQAAWSPLTMSSPRDVQKEWRSSILNTGISYNNADLRMTLGRKSRLLGLSPRNTHRYLRPRLTQEGLSEFLRRGQKKVWLPTEYDRLAALGFCKEKGAL